MKSKFATLAALTLAIGYATRSYAASSSSDPSGPGFYFSVHGDPAPSLYGFNLSYRPAVLKYVRFWGGVGGFSSDLINGTDTFLDWTIIPIAYAFTWFFTAGHGGHYKDWKPNYSPEGQALLTWGGGAKFAIPLSAKSGVFEPVVGVNWSHLEPTGEPWGFQAPSSQLYYSFGVDAGQTDVMHGGFGFNWCPSLPIASCGFYVDIGAYM